jgi:glutathione peroxidase-family protein
MKQTVEQLRQKMVDYIGYDSIYDIPLTNADGTENDILKKHKGKVTVLFNTTGHCGNSPQFDIMQQLYEEVKDLGVEFLAVPTNDYCGPGVTYGEFTDGIINAKASENFARSYHEVTFPFSEIQSSRNLSI